MRSLLRNLPFALVLSVLPLHAGEKKPPPVSIRLHSEGNEKEGDSFVTPIELTNPQKKIFIRRVPILTERDIKKFLPFPGRDGMVGAYFFLDPHGADKLEQFTTEDRGKLAVVMINGRVGAALKVDKRVTDGILFVPGGIMPNEVALLQAKYPVIGRESEFGKKPPKEKKPQ
ncbi:MAG: hypothetical protein D4R65_11085 [Verrucomicrobiaceae bacterium]|nr:MAG: hypothetical protein D4R65_11085 [Verrucomicrobiaceae bacterium]